MSGRKPKVTIEKYLNAVRSKRTDKDIVIAKYLGVHRSNISRFKKNNPNVLILAKNILVKYTSIVFDAKNLTFEAFNRIPIIEKWVKIQEDRTCTKQTIKNRVRSFYNVCKYLNVHPENLTVEQASDLVNVSKKAYYSNNKFIRGLAFLSIRKPVRSWFELIHGVSGELLTSMGIHAESSRGTGSASKERVTKEQRRIFDKVLYDCVHEVVYSENKFSQYRDKIDILYTEMKGLTHFMYYTATRIGKTNPDTQGCYGTRLDNNAHVISENIWKINLLDKGKLGGLLWDKMLIEDGILKLKSYVSERFNIPIDEVALRLKTIDEYLFPLIRSDYELERKIMRLALEKAGVTTRNPNHIWRHTFAQDFLHASDWNYELCASLGGWKDTGTLKKHYGKMTEEAKERGLKKVMGLPVEDVTYLLKW